MIDADTMRRIMLDALDSQTERYRAKARDLHMLDDSKPNNGFDMGAQEYCRLAQAAEQLRNQIKETS